MAAAPAIARPRPASAALASAKGPNVIDNGRLTTRGRDEACGSSQRRLGGSPDFVYRRPTGSATTAIRGTPTSSLVSSRRTRKSRVRRGPEDHPEAPKASKGRPRAGILLTRLRAAVHFLLTRAFRLRRSAQRRPRFSIPRPAPGAIVGLVFLLGAVLCLVVITYVQAPPRPRALGFAVPALPRRVILIKQT
jgi:hypothetical protein